MVRLNQLSVLKTSFFSGLSRLSYSLFSFSSTIDSYGSVEVQRCRNFTALSFISSFLLTTFKDTAGAMNFNNSWNLVQLKKRKMHVYFTLMFSLTLIYNLSCFIINFLAKYD